MLIAGLPQLPTTRSAPTTAGHSQPSCSTTTSQTKLPGRQNHSTHTSKLSSIRNLGSLRAQTSSWWPFEPAWDPLPWVYLISASAPFGRSGRVTYAMVRSLDSVLSAWKDSGTEFMFHLCVHTVWDKPPLSCFEVARKGKDRVPLPSLCAPLIDIARPGHQRPTEGNLDGGGGEQGELFKKGK